MEFGDALADLKRGGRIARLSWMRVGQFLYLTPSTPVCVTTPPLLGFYAPGEVITTRSRIDCRRADGEIEAWAATSDDLLADDWIRV